jgi:hypothetical protein
MKSELRHRRLKNLKRSNLRKESVLNNRLKGRTVDSVFRKENVIMVISSAKMKF